MGRIKKEDIGWLVLLSFIIVAVVYLIRYSNDVEMRKAEQKRHEVAQRDSLNRVEQAEFAKEYNEHLIQFYDAFIKYYPVFSSPEDLEEWLLHANFSAFELLHRLYSEKYDGYAGVDGFYKLSEFLFWSPPEYDIECETCGEITSFSEEEWP